jgi:hypothetical protein
MQQRLMTAVMVAALLLTTFTSALATQDRAYCASGQVPQYAGGFAELKSQLADWQGDPITCEFADPNGSGDILQRTTTGLAFWRKSTNTPTFTNGIDHWALTAARGLVYWNGSNVDPPAEALPGTPHPCLAARTCLAPRSAAQVQAVPPTATSSQVSDLDQIYQTRNGPRTAAQLRDELAAAGYGGPWDADSVMAAYTRASPPMVDPYPDDKSWHCLAANPSCAQDPWWAEWNALQEETRVSYSAVGTGFGTERRFAEAVNLLWQWPNGKGLLQQADRSRVLVMTLDYDQQTAYATYLPQRNVVAVNRRYTTAPTWMLAGVVAHELSHAQNHSQGVHTQATSADCLAGETDAFQVERQYLVWLTRTHRPEGLPSLAVVTAKVPAEHAQLAHDLYEVGFSDSLRELVGEIYERECR